MAQTGYFLVPRLLDLFNACEGSLGTSLAQNSKLVKTDTFALIPASHDPRVASATNRDFYMPHLFATPTHHIIIIATVCTYY